MEVVPIAAKVLFVNWIKAIIWSFYRHKYSSKRKKKCPVHLPFKCSHHAGTLSLVVNQIHWSAMIQIWQIPDIGNLSILNKRNQHTYVRLWLAVWTSLHILCMHKTFQLTYEPFLTKSSFCHRRRQNDCHGNLVLKQMFLDTFH
jgi:hypothetical protein